MGVVNRRWVWVECMGVVLRRYIDFLIINYYLSLLLSGLYSSAYTYSDDSLAI